MRVLAARFPDRQRASQVLGWLHRRFPVDPRDVAIAPLGMLEHPKGSDTLLAGRFPEEWTDQVSELVSEAGGEIVANVDERWTRPRHSYSARSSYSEGLSRGRS